jgi:hypothetical protein
MVGDGARHRTVALVTTNAEIGGSADDAVAESGRIGRGISQADRL